MCRFVILLEWLINSFCVHLDLLAIVRVGDRFRRLSELLRGHSCDWILSGLLGCTRILCISCIVLLVDELLVLEVIEVKRTVRILEQLRVSDETLVNLTGGLSLRLLLLVVCYVLVHPGLILLIQPHLIVRYPVLLVVSPLLLVRVLLLLLLLSSAIGVCSVPMLLLILHVLVEGERLGSVLSCLGQRSLLEQLTLEVGILRLVVLK